VNRNSWIKDASIKSFLNLRRNSLDMKKLDEIPRIHFISNKGIFKDIVNILKKIERKEELKYNNI
jgi:hypothetical protein